MAKVEAHQAPYAPIHVTFSHPGMNPRSLTVETGMDGVQWSYNLNTKKYNTYGGEVIQILSANIGQLVIQGTCRDYEELDQIYSWFHDYLFNLRGAHLNNPETIAQHTQSGQQPVKISYPHRGWEWDVYIVEAPEYRIGREVVAPNWRVVAEFFHPEDKEDLAAEVKNSFISTLTDGITPSMVLNRLDGLYSDPLPTVSGDIDQVDPSEIAATMGNNFQRMIAAWSFGDFARFAYDAIDLDQVNAFSKSQDEYFKAVYGTDIIALEREGSGVTPGTGGVSGPWPGNEAPAAERAMWLAAKAQAAGLPPVLPVMAGLVESGLQNLPGGDADSVGIFQMRVGIWNKPPYQGYPDNVDLQIQWFIDQATAPALKNGHPERTATLNNAVQLGEWVADVERPLESLRGKYALRYNEAMNLIAGLDEYIARQGGGSGLNGSAREKLRTAMQWLHDNRNRVRYDRGAAARETWQQVPVADIGVRPLTMEIAADCSSSTQAIFSWALSYDVDGQGVHNRGWSGYTGSMLSRLNQQVAQGKARKVSRAQCKPGDIHIVDSSSRAHVNVIFSNDNGNTMVFNHGSNSESSRSIIKPFYDMGGEIYDIVSFMQDT